MKTVSLIVSAGFYDIIFAFAIAILLLSISSFIRRAYLLQFIDGFECPSLTEILFVFLFVPIICPIFRSVDQYFLIFLNFFQIRYFITKL